MRIGTRSTSLLLVVSFILAVLSLVPSALAAPPFPNATTSSPPPSATPNFILPPSAPTSPAAPAPTPGSSNQTTLPSAAAGCPPPLVPNSLNLTSGTCIGPCCLPCPASSVFYEPQKLENIYTITSIVRAISATSCAILTICYLILPSRRKHPHLIVLSFSTLMIPWEGLGTIWMYKKADLLCKNVFEIATMSNSWLCGLQGIALMYIVLVMLCLGFLLIANLHLLTVYRATLIQSNLTKLIIFSFFLPLSLVLPVSIRKQIENPGFGSICFVSSEVASPYFFYPLSVIVCIATLLHLGTIAFMTRASVKANANSASVSDSTSYNPNSDTQSNKTLSKRQRRLLAAREISLLLKQQWRAGLFALCLLIIDMVYWLFYFVEAKKLLTIDPTKGWFPDWIQCLKVQTMSSIKEGRLPINRLPTPTELKAAGDVAQAVCASTARPFVPSFVWAATADLLPALFGIAVLIIFGSKMELWSDLRVRLFGGTDSTVFIMGDITKENRDRNQMYQQQRHNQRSEGHHHQQHPSSNQGHGRDIMNSKQQQQHQQQHQDGFYNDDSLTVVEDDGGLYHSRDILTSQQIQAYQYNNQSTPTSPTSPSFGGPVRKISVTIEDREPIYYRNPALETQSPVLSETHQQQSRAKRMVEGSEPWPSWPSSTSHVLSNGAMVATTPLSPRPVLSVKTRQGSNSSNGQSPASPRSPDRGFYNSDDISPTIATSSRSVAFPSVSNSHGAAPMTFPSRGSSRNVSSAPRTQQRQQQQYQQQDVVISEASKVHLQYSPSSPSSTPSFPMQSSPRSAADRAMSPPIPRKSDLRRV
ncbi:hypothetical protein BGZ83_007768 [Gryganskiella cystojenkinii]|nr:hypothetical protein BGZ83_007768 [Gryganskiella cystojenkinii]